MMLPIPSVSGVHEEAVMRISSVTLLVLAMPGIAVAQDRGAISGIITDASGGVVPEAKIVLQNPATNLSHNVVTSAAGVYTFVNLSAGDYKVSVAKAGFRTIETPLVHVDVNTTTHLDL